MESNTLGHDELNLLSQLTALDPPMDPKKTHPITVSEMVHFHQGHVELLVGDAAMTAKEWKTTLGLIAANEDLMGLTILSLANRPENGLFALCFSDEAKGHAILTFRGTVGAGGWIDNAKGAFVPDTPQQLCALIFKKQMDKAYHFNSYDLVGHSKGGNCAQYITVRDPKKIKRCVTFNAPGFSPEFMEKYAQEIEINQDKITAYEGAYDIVNILLNPVADKRIVVDTGALDPKNNHKPNHILSRSGKIAPRRRRHPLYAAAQDVSIHLVDGIKAIRQKRHEKSRK